MLPFRSFIYLARELVPSKLQGDERYPILVRQVPLKDFECLITSKQMLDARVIAALFLARSFLENADVSVPDMHSDVSGAL